MKNNIGLCVVLSISLLSGCAYMEGRKNQTEVPATPTTHVNKSVHNTQMMSMPNTAPNPSTTVSKMLAPVVQ